ncbi:MAG: ribulose-phosphate 3-epimerase [Chloroflexi bacterium]|nr:ribulose-phosphate 3-epimerase [Chloroflexota bacterium]
MSQGSPLRLGAALFNGDHGHLADEVARLQAVGLDFIHLDVFDGHFVPDLGFSPRTIAQLRPLGRLPFEVHLGVENMRHVAPQLADAGVDLILFHVESSTMLYEDLFFMRELGVRVGLAITLGTPITVLEPVIGQLDAVLLLSRVTGEGSRGAVFNPLVLPRLRAVCAMAEAAGLKLDLQVAGSVKRQHIPQLLAAGTTAIAFGGGLYRLPDMATEVAEMRKLAQEQAR